MLKFRSMKAEAESKSGPVFAREDDPRRTAIGTFLRKSSLDEFPQLINVLRGEMSLVGPRPERPFFVDRFKDNVPKYLDRHRVKTGMTGWAQVNGLRGNTSIEERIKYDVYYIENWSLWLDVKILLRTVRALFPSKHAY
jgi:lipopolysaccharide/colanic/teichoic acid biosynthesis glycosyltransferase